MATREVDETELAALVNVERTVARILKHPEGRKLILKARKAVDPTVSIPEIDAAAPVEAAVDGALSEIRKLREDLAERDRKSEEDRIINTFASKWEDQKSQLRRAGWRSSGIEAVQKFAEENSIADLSIAADAYAARNPDPSPSTSSNGAWDMFGGGGGDNKEDTFVEDMMKSGGADERRLDREIQDILRDVRSQR